MQVPLGFLALAALSSSAVPSAASRGIDPAYTRRSGVLKAVAVVSHLAVKLIERFAWVDGHADVWRLFADANLFADLTAALADPFRGAGITRVAGIESRGFILGGAVAVHLGVGFAAIRKSDGLLPGPKLVRQTEPDYRGLRPVLRLQRSAVGAADRVLLVDDWIERGSQAAAAKALIEKAAGTWGGLSVIVDEADPAVRAGLEPVTAIVPASSLPESA